MKSKFSSKTDENCFQLAMSADELTANLKSVTEDMHTFVPPGKSTPLLTRVSIAYVICS